MGQNEFALDPCHHFGESCDLEFRFWSQKRLKTGKNGTNCRLRGRGVWLRGD